MYCQRRQVHIAVYVGAGAIVCRVCNCKVSNYQSLYQKSCIIFFVSDLSLLFNWNDSLHPSSNKVTRNKHLLGGFQPQNCTKELPSFVPHSQMVVHINFINDSRTFLGVLYQNQICQIKCLLNSFYYIYYKDGMIN